MTQRHDRRDPGPPASDRAGRDASRRPRRGSGRRLADAGRRLGPAALGCALALAIAACGDGPSATAGAAGLTEGEAQDLAAALAGQGADMAEDEAGGISPSSSATAPGGGPPVSNATFELDFQRTRDCPEGGEVTVDGTAVAETDTATATVTATVDAEVLHDACGVPVRGGTTVFVTADPGLTFTADLRAVEQQLDGAQTSALAGSVAWETDDDRSGTCDVDLDWTLDPDARSISLVGSVCDVEVERTLTRTS